MSQCLNPDCLAFNPNQSKYCQKCGSKIILQERYRPIKIIGQGGFGKTFLAIDEGKPSRPNCVIKQFFPIAQGTDSVEKASKLFEQEAILLEDLGSHPQIPSLLAYFSHEQRQYLVQEYIPGDNLAQELAQQGVFNQLEIRKLLLDILEVLQFAHSKQVIHRDVKPENIIRRSSDRRPVLVDFGAAKNANMASLNVTGTIIGSAEYISPEQARGKAEPCSDLYSLGVTCLYLLTNVSPFDLFNTSELTWCWRDFLNQNQVDPALGKILDKLVDPRNKKRYQSTREVLADLKSLPVSAPTPPTIVTVPPTVINTPTLTRNQTQSTQSNFNNLDYFNFEVVIIDGVESSGIFGRNKILKKRQVQRQAFYLKVNLNSQVTLDLVKIPAGTMIMGSPANEPERNEDEGPQHQVTLSPFLMSKYPITQAQYLAVTNRNPSRFQDPNLPVESVSWHDAVNFCQLISTKLGKKFRLPSEAEWEYACRGGTTTPFYFGETITSELANYDSNFVYGKGTRSKPRGQTTVVESFPPNNFGLYDLHGNVWEWCLDTWHPSYQGAPNDGRPWIDGGNQDRLLRGGAWVNFPQVCRCANRAHTSPKKVRDTIGFRVVLEL